jgi:N-acetylneuraminic acid mutarotase
VPSGAPFGSSGRNVKDGGCLTSASDECYALKGNNSCEFYRYSNAEGNWTTLEQIPLPSSSSRKRVRKGGTLAAVGGKAYATKGGSTLEFWCYTPGEQNQGTWERMSDVPRVGNTIKEGAGAVGVSNQGSDYVYLLKGSNTYEFYRYDVAQDGWTTLPSAPAGNHSKRYKAGSCITWDGSDNIFCLKGSCNEFYRYSVSGQTWTTLADLPLTGSAGRKKAKDGASLAYSDGSVYALKGGNTREFWKYDFASNTWTEQPNMPLGSYSRRVKGGGALANVGGVLLALKGNNTREFYAYYPGGAFEPPGCPQPPPPGPTEELIYEGYDILSPRWSHAGDRVCFVKDDESGYQNLFVAGVGDSTVQLTYLQGEVRDPAWCFNDSLIAFTFEHKDSLYSQIACIPADPSVGGNATILTSSPTWHELPDWHPDTLSLLCQVEDSLGYQQASIVSLKDGSEEMLTSGTRDHEQPKWASSSGFAFLREDDNGIVQTWDARGDVRNRLPEGVYFLDYRTLNHRQARKVVLTK